MTKPNKTKKENYTVVFGGELGGLTEMTRQHISDIDSMLSTPNLTKKQIGDLSLAKNILGIALKKMEKALV